MIDEQEIELEEAVEQEHFARFAWQEKARKLNETRSRFYDETFLAIVSHRAANGVIQ